MISKRLLPLTLAAIATLPFVADTAEARDNKPSRVERASERNNTAAPLFCTSNTQKMLDERPAHIDRLAWRNLASNPGFVDNDRPVSRTRYLARAWHPKHAFKRLRAIVCPNKD